MMSKFNLPLDLSFLWCGALQSPWTQKLLHDLLDSGSSGFLYAFPFEGEGFAESGLHTIDGLENAAYSRLLCIDDMKDVKGQATSMFFWEIPRPSESTLLSLPEQAWGGLLRSIESTLSSLRLWMKEPHREDQRFEPCVVMLWPESGRTIEHPLSPWQALHESWMRSLIEQLATELETSGLRFLSLPSGVPLEGLLERLPRKEKGETEAAQGAEETSSDETKLLRWKIQRLVGTLREVVRLLRGLQTHLERFGFLRRQRLSQRFFKLSGLRLLDWETQFHRMITGWGHLLQVHNLRLLPSFMRDRLQADRKTAELLQQLCSSLSHFPQEQDAPQKAALASLRQEREILVAAIRHFLREFEEIESLWKKQAGTLAAMGPHLHASSEQASLPQA